LIGLDYEVKYIKNKGVIPRNKASKLI